MKRLIKRFNLIALLLIPALIFSYLPSPVSAEEITITTYYPSPYGSYNNLTVGTALNLVYGTGIVKAGASAAGPFSDIMTISASGITFLVPVVFNQGMTINGPLTVNGLLTVNGNIIAQLSSGNITASGSITSTGGTITANRNYIKGAGVRDSLTGYDIGTSLAIRKNSDVAERGYLYSTQAALESCVAIAALQLAIAPRTAATAFGVFDAWLIATTAAEILHPIPANASYP